MNKILILTISAGGGHDEVAFNLKSELTSNNFIIKVVNALNTYNKTIDSLVTKSFNLVTDKFPSMFGKIYYFSDTEDSNKFISDPLIKIFADKLKKLIQVENPDLIISTNYLFIKIISYLKESKSISVPHISVITDIDVHWACVSSFVDAYIVANEYSTRSLIEKGMPKNKIYPYGIPIKNKFYSLKKLPVYKGEKLKLLLMSGALGMTEIQNVVDEIIDFNGIEHITIVCGKNEKLKHTLEEKYQEKIVNGFLNLYGFTNNIPELMSNSHILITKPGGVTISEAIAIHIPMIIPYFIPGQEELNLEFLLEEGVAIHSLQNKDLKIILNDIINNPNILNQMIDKMCKVNEVNYKGISLLCQDLIENGNYSNFVNNL